MGYDSASATPTTSSVESRHTRLSGRKQKKRVSEAASSLLSLQRSVPSESDDTDTPSQPRLQSRSRSRSPIAGREAVEQTDPRATDVSVQTVLTKDTICAIEHDNRTRLVEATSTNDTCGVYTREWYEGQTEKVTFYTGVPSLGVLDIVFTRIAPNLSPMKLDKWQQLLLCLVKLRMNYLFRDIAYQIGVSVGTVQRTFPTTLNALYVHLDFCTSMPMCFRKEFGNKVAVIIDCFELFSKTLSGAINKVLTYSNYKHQQTVKLLIGISPQGTITFLSQGWGGRTSDKHIVQTCGILSNLLAGDIIMTDRGFKIEEDVALYQAKLVIPDYTRGKKRLHPLEVEHTRKVASARIHVERVIGLVVGKFRIFESEVPLAFLKLRHGESVPTIDKVMRVCCCLTN